jgi:DNA ligase (NAD+)
MNSEYASLRSRVEQLSHDYYQLNLSTVSDDEFDRLVRELAKMEDRLGIHDLTSPTKRVGGTTTGKFEKVAHFVPMLSLDNVFTEDEIAAFFKTNHALIAEPKIDGLSCALRYRDGLLERALTRGDGREGDDVTANVRTIKNVPLEITIKSPVEIRGEIYMPKKTFAAIVRAQTESGEEPFANARNAAAGSLKQKDPSVTARRGLKFIAYQAFGEGLEFDDYLAQLVTLGHHGFLTPYNCETEFAAAREETPASVSVDWYAQARNAYEFETDGAVLKVRYTTVRRELGLGTKSPRWACALKFPPERKSTRLIGVTCQVGRTGVITPVAELEPVVLSGATVKRASLCNQDEVERLGISVGDLVFVERAAEVIPKVVGLANKHVSGHAHWKMPSACPCCQTPLKKDEGKVAYYCPNHACPDQVFERLRHAVAKSALDLDGCGDAYVRILMNADVRDLADLMEVPEHSLHSVGAGKSAATKFVLERERVKSAPLWRKYHALGIEGVGQTVCKELALAYPTILDLARASDLETRVGPVRAAAIRAYLIDNADMIERLDRVGFRFGEPQAAAGEAQGAKPLQGKVLCITGTLMSGSREAVAAKIEKAGGLVKGSVGKKTDYLIIGDMPGANKTSAAKKYGTKVLSEEELYALLGEKFELAQQVNVDDL